MVIIIVENASPALRGLLSRWMIEPKAGVFVGNISALVRDRLWDKYLTTMPKGSAVQIWSSNNEQGFEMRIFGDRDRVLVDYDGLTLIKKLLNP